jgi:hypothetical protein
MAGRPEPRRPRWYGIPVRAAIITFLLTLLTFAVSLLLGIVGILGIAKMRGVAPNLAPAYRQVAFPAAMAVGAVVLVLSLIVEARRYRRGQVLRQIEQESQITR